MSNITLRQLRYFDALAEHGHFGRAAEACAVSQPALSVQIKELEDALGCILCERMPRQVRLTTLGREFLRRTRDILRAVDELEDVSRAARDHWVGELRIGVIPTIAPYLLPKIVQELTEQFPGAEIHMRETMTSNLIRELIDGRIDTAISILWINFCAIWKSVVGITQNSSLRYPDIYSNSSALTDSAFSEWGSPRRLLVLIRFPVYAIAFFP